MMHDRAALIFTQQEGV